jgi:UDPglucose--hexose-1-phosphate uridylyltransferase
MSEIRQNPATKEWVIVATERAKRPEDFVKLAKPRRVPRFSKKCPFCPGHEDQTPPEISSYRTERGAWTVRVVPNRFAALSPGGDSIREENIDFFRRMPGLGQHEVIIETPLHNLSLGRTGDEKALEIVSMYHERFRCLSRDKRFKLITIFRNYGREAGTSLEHPHSQIVATPVVPFHIRHRLEEATRFFDDTGECVFCRIIESEQKEKIRVVMQADGFIVIEPFASRSPFETWILPLRHRSTFGEAAADEIGGFARILNRVLEKFVRVLQDPAFNMVIQTAPTNEEEEDYYHWHVKLFPRVTTPAGFELGTGVYINTVLPEAAAEYLRKT